jgi:hypothetical protein
MEVRPGPSGQRYPNTFYLTYSLFKRWTQVVPTLIPLTSESLQPGCSGRRRIESFYVYSRHQVLEFGLLRICELARCTYAPQVLGYISYIYTR